MISIVAATAGVIAGSLIFLFLLLICYRSASSPPQEKPSPLPAVGATVRGDFTCQGEFIHALCRVEEQKDSRLTLRILSGIGKIPLARLRPEMTGQLEVGPSLLPLKITQVDFPQVKVAAFPERTHPAYRESLRLPASFSVRFRPQGKLSPWMTGKGMDISNDGFAFFSPYLLEPRLGLLCEVELTLVFPAGEKETISLKAEVQWIKETSGGKEVGLQLADPSHRKDLARAVYRLEHQLTHRPEDFLTVALPSARIEN
jgi:hypothetical protein